jgi:thioredoxin reductase
MTSPVEFPMYGKFKKTELSKEALLAFWDTVLNRADFNVRTDEKVEDIKKAADGVFTVATVNNQYRARAVVLALGRTGTPRKLGVKGEELSKVMYRLIEADHYVNKQILAVGGGDSAVEAAMGLACQVGPRAGAGSLWCLLRSWLPLYWCRESGRVSERARLCARRLCRPPSLQCR